MARIRNEPLSPSDWVMYLNTRAMEYGNMVANKRIVNLNRIVIIFAVVNLFIVALIGMISLLDWDKLFSLIFIITIILGYSIYIVYLIRKMDRGFKEYFIDYSKKTIAIDTLILKIIDGELTTYEEIREEYNKLPQFLV